MMWDIPFKTQQYGNEIRSYSLCVMKAVITIWEQEIFMIDCHGENCENILA
jgi:hypothetical protein